MRAMERHSYVWKAATWYVSYMASVEHSLKKSTKMITKVPRPRLRRHLFVMLARRISRRNSSTQRIHMHISLKTIFPALSHHKCVRRIHDWTVSRILLQSVL